MDANDNARMRRRWWTTVAAVISGVCAVIALLFTAVTIFVPHVTVNLSFDFGHGVTFALHRWSFAIVVGALTVWFAALTRALWRNRRSAWWMLALTALVIVALAVVIVADRVCSIQLPAVHCRA